MVSKCYQKKRNLVTRKVLDETVVVPIRNNVGSLDSIFTLNELGSIIWELLDGQTSAGEIVEKVCDGYNVSREDAVRDVTEFLSTLVELDLVAEEKRL